MYVIDQKMIFWDTEGGCADASFSIALYGTTPQQVLCKSVDSIFGPNGGSVATTRCEERYSSKPHGVTKR